MKFAHGTWFDGDFRHRNRLRDVENGRIDDPDGPSTEWCHWHLGHLEGKRSGCLTARISYWCSIVRGYVFPDMSIANTRRTIQSFRTYRRGRCTTRGTECVQTQKCRSESSLLVLPLEYGGASPSTDIPRSVYFWRAVPG